jgi:hypothetical protein
MKDFDQGARTGLIGNTRMSEEAEQVLLRDTQSADAVEAGQSYASS